MRVCKYAVCGDAEYAEYAVCTYASLQSMQHTSDQVGLNEHAMMLIGM